jgi:hypothetical protein
MKEEGEKIGKELMKLVSANIVNASRQFVPLFSLAVKIAAQEGDRAGLEKMAKSAEHYRDALNFYIDHLQVESLDPSIIQLHDYFTENAKELREALGRQPDGDEWKAQS